MLFLLFLQVCYLLSQVQRKIVCEESDEAKQKEEEDSKQNELLQRLKVQVRLQSAI